MMAHLTLELILWLLLAFLIGCIIGCLLRKIFGGSSKAATGGAGAATAATAVAASAKPEARPEPKPAPAPAPEPVAKPEPKPAPKPMAAAAPAKPAPKPKAKPEPKPKKADVATGVAKRPKGLSAARGGKPDELQRISGVGPKLEKTLHSLGFFHFDQIAAWTRDEVQWVDEHLRFKGRIDRDEWIPQAELLANGKEEEFAKLYGTGGMKDKKTGKTKSGSRTRKS